MKREKKTYSVIFGPKSDPMACESYETEASSKKEAVSKVRRHVPARWVLRECSRVD